MRIIIESLREVARELNLQEAFTREKSTEEVLMMLAQRIEEKFDA